MEEETGDVYVSDRDNNRIDKFSAEGEFLLAWGWGVLDGETEVLQTCTTTTKCFKGLEGPGAGEFSSAQGIAVDNDPLSLSHGDVYVIDAGNNARVQKFDPEGNFLTSFGREVNSSTKGNICPASEAEFCVGGVEATSPAGPGEFEALGGRAIAVDDATGTVYVGDRNRVQRFSDEGAPESEVLFSEVGPIQNLALDSVKDIYLKGGLQGREAVPGGVHKYDPSGVELGSPRDEAGFREGLSITIGPADELFVNDLQARHHLLAFNAEGEQLASFDAGEQAQNGQRGIAYSEHIKAIYVLNEGTVRIVTPPPPGPLVLLESESSSEVGTTSATLGASINPEGPEATSYHFEYGATTAYGQSTAPTPLEGEPFEDQPASAAITGLSPETTYHFRVVAENAAKEVAFGADQSFTTLPAISIDDTSVSELDATSARLEAELNPHGLASEYRFEYGTSSAYGTSVPIPDGSVGDSTSDTTVSELVQELLPSTTYHYRVIAHNTLGTVIGTDHSFTTQGPSSILADGRTWELVSPPNKHGSPLESLTEEGGLIQAAAGGGGMAYVALGPISGESQGVRSPHDSQLLSTRGTTGWSTEDISTPHEEISIIRAGFSSEYKFFAEDLSSSVVEPEGVTRLQPENPANTERTPYQREADGAFVALVNAANVPAGTKFGGTETTPGGQWGGGAEFRTATPDLSHIVLESPQVLAPGFAPGFEPVGEPNLYELAGGKLTLISVLPGPSAEPASEAGLAVGVGQSDLNMRGALSNDGGRVAFETTGGEGHLYLRDIVLSQTLQLDERQPGAAGGPGSPVFQIANSDGTKVFFTDESQLTADATAEPNEPDLYMCEVQVKGGQLLCALSDLSVNPTPGEAANVRGKVSAIDASGGRVYFVANGVLTNTANAQGEHGVAGDCESPGGATCNLYEYDTGTRQIGLVAVLSSHDDPDWAGRTSLEALGNLTARSSPNGRYFTFMSQRSLTGYDNRDANSGEPDEEVFLFDAQSGKLNCVSCDPSGARPEGIFDPSTATFPGLTVDRPRSWRERWLAGSIPSWTLQALNRALYQPRYLADSGRTFLTPPTPWSPKT